MMMSALVPLMAAAALAAPQLRDRLATANVTVPTGDGSATYEIFIAPDGWVDDCQVVRSDYDALQDDRVCRQLMRERARKPAIGADGKPVHAVATVTRQRGSESAAPAPLADIVLEVASVPGSDKGRKSIGLNVLVDAKGRIAACEAAEEGEEAFAQVACQEAQSIEFRPREDREGASVPYLTGLTVDFVEQGAAG